MKRKVTVVKDVIMFARKVTISLLLDRNSKLRGEQIVEMITYVVPLNQLVEVVDEERKARGLAADWQAQIQQRPTSRNESKLIDSVG